MLSPEVSRLAARVVNDNYVPDDVRAEINSASSDEEMLAALAKVDPAVTTSP